ncbi:MAG: hypothetical protein QW177_08185 [Candidatus Nitrosotenuis sp.]
MGFKTKVLSGYQVVEGRYRSTQTYKKAGTRVRVYRSPYSGTRPTTSAGRHS